MSDQDKSFTEAVEARIAKFNSEEQHAERLAVDYNLGQSVGAFYMGALAQTAEVPPAITLTYRWIELLYARQKELAEAAKAALGRTVGGTG